MCEQFVFGAFEKKNELIDMHYEDFSRHLREKYSTRLHLLDQLVDQLKQRNQPSKVSGNETRNVSEPYLNECILAAERMRNNRRSERDRQICYENLLLVEKLERIRKQSGRNSRENLEKDYQNHCRLSTTKSHDDHQRIKSITRRFLTKSSQLSNEQTSSYQTPSVISSEGDISDSEVDDDQATAADVDASINSSDLQHRIHRKVRHVRSMKTDRAYEHLTNIDMTMIRDRSPASQNHLSLSSRRTSFQDRPYALKKEILYH